MMIVMLALQGVVFTVWAFWMFKVLFALRRRAVAETGRAFPGPGATLKQFADFLRVPEFAADRRVLGGLTAGLVTLTLGFAVVAVH